MLCKMAQNLSLNESKGRHKSQGMQSPLAVGQGTTKPGRLQKEAAQP